jgi:protein-disulfide isomerase
MKKYRRTQDAKLGLLLLVMLLFSPWPLQGEETAGALATVEGRAITEADIGNTIAGQMVRINSQIYTLKKQAVDALIADHLLAQEAKKRGVSREQLLQQEVNAKVGAASDAEVEQVYNANKARLGNKTLEEMKPQLLQQLQSGKLQQQQQAFTQSLRKAAAVKMLLKPPLIEVALDGAPVRGPAAAPVTIVEFSDYQ